MPRFSRAPAYFALGERGAAYEVAEIAGARPAERRPVYSQ